MGSRQVAARENLIRGMPLDLQGSLTSRGDNVRPPRFRIAWVMGAVPVIALNFGLLRAMLGLEGKGAQFACAASLPMANVLLVASLDVRRRPFLRGFVIFGLLAWLCFLLDVCSGAPTLTMLYLAPIRHLLSTIMDYSLLAGLAVCSVWATCPQLCFALIGRHVVHARATVRVSRAIDVIPEAGLPGWDARRRGLPTTPVTEPGCKPGLGAPHFLHAKARRPWPTPTPAGAKSREISPCQSGNAGPSPRHVEPAHARLRQVFRPAAVGKRAVPGLRPSLTPRLGHPPARARPAQAVPAPGAFARPRR